MTLSPGIRLGPYEIQSPLGAGGMGEVYRARDTRLARDVAIKVLPDHLSDNPKALARFQTEAKAVAALSHPKILFLLDVGEANGIHYAVTELLEGETLRALVVRGPVPAKRTLEIAHEIAEGLAAAHEKRIVHRDLKPENVFVTNDGHVKILDFGLARHETAFRDPNDTHSPTVSAFTEAGAVLGTVAYMSPEQARGQAVDHRSDIFSLGCLLFEMLSGRRPFARETAADVMSAILHEEPADLPDGTPRGLAHAVGRCLEKSPERRFQSARDLGFALKEELEGPPAPRAPHPATRSRRWLVSGAALLGVVVVAAAARVLLEARAHPGTPAAPGAIRSLAVLPFANLSVDPTQEYFSDGMTEELTATLSKISALRVISRTSAMQFKGTKKPLREIAAALGVEGIIEGSVLRSGGRVRITAQLINAATDGHVWAESYERDLADVLALQGEVARAIAGEVRAKLTPQERMWLTGARTVNPEAYGLVLKGRHLLFLAREEEVRKALEYIERAIALDPTYAPAHAALASYYVMMAYNGYQPASETTPKAKAAARRALELDEGLAEAHACLGGVMWSLEWDWPGAERELRQAIELDPSRSDTRSQYAQYLMIVGRFDGAVAEQRRAVELDPLTPSQGFLLGAVLSYARRHDDAIAQLRKTLTADPTGMGPLAHSILGINYMSLRMNDAAASECDKAVEGAPEDQMVLSNCGHVYGLTGRSEPALELMARLKSLSARHHVDPYNLAFLYDGLGDSVRAMEWLERSFTERSPQGSFVGIDFWTDRLRANPRYQDLLRRMNFPVAATP